MIQIISNMHENQIGVCRAADPGAGYGALWLSHREEGGGGVSFLSVTRRNISKGEACFPAAPAVECQARRTQAEQCKYWRPLDKK